MTRSHPRTTTVAEFIADKLAESDRTQREVAEQCGFENPNVITMFKTGATKLPLNRVGQLAKALNADPAHLLRLVMLEYAPETWEAIETNLKSTVLTANELDLVHAYRQVTGDSDATPVVIDRGAVLAIVVA
ncbi:hypothetical protein [Variovorax soli]|uniref:Transcriptional regulator with XRE-family HTH domain n=1 Tax=Variovorax soli TaxID=376815 RepID=A0ABU1NNM8_9BURK|nr:hypothetical protein [Variovorax soli]MDR6539476.1 transcriptional regulator with XRE-family HTH domain [Variovorax soli]